MGKKLIITLLSLILVSSSICTAFANSEISNATDETIYAETCNVPDEPIDTIETIYLTDEELSQIDSIFLPKERGVGTPACYEYTTKAAKLTPNDLVKLKDYTDAVYRANSKSAKASSLLNYLSFAASKWFPGTSMTLAVVSTMISETAQICPYEIVSWCFDNYTYMSSKGYSKVDANLKYRRFWNGHAYSKPWHPCQAPVARGYVR